MYVHFFVIEKFNSLMNLLWFYEKPLMGMRWKISNEQISRYLSNFLSTYFISHIWTYLKLEIFQKIKNLYSSETL